MKNKLFYIVFFMCFGLFLLLNSKVEASSKVTGIENFPDSYKPYLYELKKKYPNWQFTALYTGIDWNTAVSSEYANDRNLVPLSYSDVWKCMDSEKYNIEIDSGWVNASRRAIEYVMDPRNFLNEVRMFQFEKLTYDQNINSEGGVDKILYGTEFYNRSVSYRDSAGNIINTTPTYANLIMNAGVYSGVSPYHLAARIKQEVGPFLSHNSISGTVRGYEGLYNFYNIGATSSTEPLGAIKNGLRYALNGKGNLSNYDLQNQLIPWDSPERAIKGGAVFIGQSYILVGQNCLYLQKFDVNDERSTSLFWHQYMTNCLAPYSESSSIYNGYNSSNLLNSSIGFIIPVYENMPQYPTVSPNINLSDYVDDNTRVYANVSTTLNVRSGPATSYEVLTNISSSERFTRIGRGVQNGERWDKILLDNGIVGYVFQSYVKEAPKPVISNINLSVDNSVMNKGDKQNIKIVVTPSDFTDEVVWVSSNTDVAVVNNGEITAVNRGTVIITAKNSNGTVQDSINIEVRNPVENITLDNNNIHLIEGGKMKLNVNIVPDDAYNKNVLWSSNNDSVVKVNENGEVTAISEGDAIITVKSVENENIKVDCNVIVTKIQDGVYFELDESIFINGDEISGINVESIADFKKLVNTNLNMEFYDNKENVLDDDSEIGTGYRLCLKDDSGSEIYNYYFIIYGDVNGDGFINALDVLVLQKYILELRNLDGLFLKAGNISKNGNLPNSLDVLKIQKHILEIKFIQQ